MTPPNPSQRSTLWYYENEALLLTIRQIILLTVPSGPSNSILSRDLPRLVARQFEA